jgi:7-carboxy-7-deazaguanine synthase
MFGQNLKLAPEKSEGKSLKVTEIFATIPGEGPYSGRPAVFVRLSGCNLACSFCDTEFDKFEIMNIVDIFSEIRRLWYDFYNFSGALTKSNYLPLIVLTGGEPLRQNIAPFCALLIEKGFVVQLETNGSLACQGNLPESVDIVCSPKLSSSGFYGRINKNLQPNIRAIKFLISAHLPGYADIGDVGQSDFLKGVPIYVQPIDEVDKAKNQANYELAVRVAVKHGAILGLQLHKILSIP